MDDQCSCAVELKGADKEFVIRVYRRNGAMARGLALDERKRYAISFRIDTMDGKRSQEEPA